MIVSVLIVAHHPLLDTLRSHLKGQMNLTVCITGCGKDSQFYGV